MSGPPTIAIVGGGASGTLAAIHLLHQPTTAAASPTAPFAMPTSSTSPPGG